MSGDNSYHLLNFLGGNCLFSILISLSKVSNLFQNGYCRMISLVWRLFCYHSNGKSQMKAMKIFTLVPVL